MNTNILKVLIVDDSTVASELLTYIIESDPMLKVIGKVKDGEEAFQFLETNKPDVITMDLNLPKMDGFEVTRKILTKWSIPIVVISDFYNRQAAEKCFKALEAGALTILEKPKGIGHPEYKYMACSIIESIKTMSQIKPKLVNQSFIGASAPELIVKSSQELIEVLEKEIRRVEAIVIGTSIGGSHAIQKILSMIPSDFPVPIFVSQHITGEFLQKLIDWLSTSSNLKICLPQNGQKILSGIVYIAPGNQQMEISKNKTIVLTNISSELGPKNIIGKLFRSIANVFGANSIGIILTGLGSDGIAELLYMKQKGALTIAQDEKSSTVFDKPKQAIESDAAKLILPLESIAPMLNKMLLRNPQPHKETGAKK